MPLRVLRSRSAVFLELKDEAMPTSTDACTTTRLRRKDMRRKSARL
jgi:hypothetical protein